MSKKKQPPPRARTAAEAQEPDDADKLPLLNLPAIDDVDTLAHSLVHLMDRLGVPRHHRSMDDARRLLMVERDLLWDTVKGWSAPRLVTELRKELRKREPASASAAREPTVAESARHSAPAAPRIISAAVAAARYCVTAGTIGRHVRAKDLTDYRRPGHPSNAEHRVDESEVASLYTKRPPKAQAVAAK